MSKWCVGIDLGGTFIKLAAMDEGRNVTPTLQLPTPAGKGADGVIAQVIAGVRQLMERESLSRDQVLGAGIGAPGPMDISAGVTHAMPNIPGMENVPLRDKVASQLEVPVVLENDANAAAYGEYILGAGRDVDDMVLMTLGTGIGGGIVLDGKILHGTHEIGAELGHMIVQVEGRPCPCGQRGCLEQYCSAASLALAAERCLADTDRKSSLRQVLADNGNLDAKDIDQARKAGDILAGELWDQAAFHLAVGCVNIARIFDPAKIVLAGGMTQAGEGLLGPVQDHFRALHWKLTEPATQVVLAELGADAGVIGSAGVSWSAMDDR